MATPQWEALKMYIHGLDGDGRRRAASGLNCTLSLGSATKQQSEISRAAYSHAKARLADYNGNIGAAYDATREKIIIAVNMGATPQVPAARCEHGMPAGLPCAMCETEKAEQAAHNAAMGGADRGDVETLVSAALEKLRAEFEKKLSHAGAVTIEDVRKLTKEAVAEMPALKIEVRQGGELIGKLDGKQHKQFPELLTIAAQRMANGYFPNIWLAGPTGSGKTHAAEMLAKAFGRPFFYNGALSMSHEVLGFRDAAGTFHETPFYSGYSKPSVYLFDECDGCADNAPLLAVNGALSNGLAAFACGMVPRHPDSLILAAANTWGLGATADYVGRAKIDGAFLDRFGVRIFWDYDPELEIAISGNETWARHVQQARAGARAKGIKVLITPRATVAGSALLGAGFKLERVIDLTYGANLTPEQRGIIG